MPIITRERLSTEATRRVIAAVGGASTTAKLLGVSRASVHVWGDKGMPDYRFDQIRVRMPEIVLKLAEASSNQ